MKFKLIKLIAFEFFLLLLNFPLFSKITQTQYDELKNDYNQTRFYMVHKLGSPDTIVYNSSMEIKLNIYKIDDGKIIDNVFLGYDNDSDDGKLCLQGTILKVNIEFEKFVKIMADDPGYKIVHQDKQMALINYNDTTSGGHSVIMVQHQGGDKITITETTIEFYDNFMKKSVDKSPVKDSEKLRIEKVIKKK